MTTQTIEHEGVTLRKVSRKYEDGDFVVFSSEDVSDVILGKPYEIEDGMYYDEEYDRMDVGGWLIEPNPAIYEVAPQYKFKVGDKVIPSTLSAADRDYIGQTGVVTMEGSGCSGVDVLMSDGWTAIYKPEALTLAADAPTLKEGDRVKILAISKYGKDYVGKFGIVEELNVFDTGYISVDPEEGSGNGMYLPEQLELAPQSIEPGDEVEVLGLSVFGFDAIGKVGIVKRFFDDSFREVGHAGEAVVDFREGQANRVYKPSDLKLLRKSADTKIEPKIELKTEGETTLTNKPTAAAALKVGDKVRMISTNPYHTFGQVKTGDVGTIAAVRTKSLIVADFPAQSNWHGKPEEFELVVEEPALKVGDKVRVLHADRGLFEDQADGSIGVIEHFGDDSSYPIKVVIDGDYDRYPESALELFEEPIAERKFKAGDRVTVSNHPYSMADGSEGTVADMAQGGHRGEYRVDVDGMASSVPIGFYENELTLVDEFAQFQPGDKVTVVSGGGDTPLWGYENGGEYFVKTNDYSHTRGRLIRIVKGIDGDGGGYALPSQLKKVEAKIEEKVEPIKKGDFVKITGRIDGWDHDLTRGEEYEVIGLSSPGFYIRSDSGVRAYVGSYESDKYEKVDAPASAPKAPALKVGDYITITFGLEPTDFSYVDLTEGKAYKVFETERGELAFRDDVNDRRIRQIEQGAYTIVDAPAPTPAPIVKSEGGFKVGDVVEVIANKHGHGFSIGDKVRIFEIVNYGFNKIRAEKLDGTRIRQAFFTPDEIKMSVELAPKYKVGDRVSVTDGGYGLVANQMTGTVDNVDKSGECYGVKLDNYEGMCALNFYTSEIVGLIAPRKLQVGDIVRVGASSSVNPAGAIGEVTEVGTSTARVNAGFGEVGNYTGISKLELIVAVENREDK